MKHAVAIWAHQSQVLRFRLRGATKPVDGYAVVRLNKALSKFSESLGKIECTGLAFQLPGLGQSGCLDTPRQAPVSLKLAVQDVRLAPF